MEQKTLKGERDAEREETGAMFDSLHLKTQLGRESLARWREGVNTTRTEQRQATGFLCFLNVGGQK